MAGVSASAEAVRGVRAAPAALAAQPSTTPRASRRLVSLDAFRGMAIAAMILVNNPGAWSDVYAPLRHSAWNGCTVADLIFPFFLFIMGVALRFSVGQRQMDGAARRHLYTDVLRRTAVIFALGVFLNGFPLFDWSVLRLPGVLQRIAVCYGVSALIVLNSSWRRQASIATALVVGYWIAAVFVPVAGQVDGPFGAEGNLAARVDDALLHGHLLYDGWDPEGLLTTLPAIATTLIGVLTGHWLLVARTPTAQVAGLVGAGWVGAAGGLLLNRWCPINKNLWTSSYVVFTAGMALLVFALCHWLIDVRGYRRWATPFVSYGRNPIVAYVLSSLVAKELLLWRVARADGSTIDLARYLYESLFLPLARPVDASLLYAVAYVLLWLGVASYLNRQGVLIKI